MAKNNWGRIHTDLTSSMNANFLESYMHSSADTFKIGRSILEDKIDKSQIENDFREVVFKILREELAYYKAIEKEYLSQVNSNLEEGKKFKDIEELRKQFEANYREVIKGTVIESQIQIKEARIDMNKKIPWIPKNKRSEDFYQKHWDQNYKFLQDNVKAIEAIVKDVLNDFDVIMRPGRKLSKKDHNLKKYKETWYKFIRLYLGLPPRATITAKDLQNFKVEGFLSSMIPYHKQLLWTALITKSAAPYGLVFEQELAELTADARLEIFLSQEFRKNKSKMVQGTYDTKKTVRDIVLSEAKVKGRKFKIGASLKMRADDKIEGKYDLKKADYLDSNLRSMGKRKKAEIRYLRKNYNLIQGQENSFRDFESDLMIIFGVTRFLNALVEKNRAEKKSNDYTMFIISRNEIYLVSDIVAKLIEKLYNTEIDKIEGFEAEIIKSSILQDNGKGELYKRKLEFLKSSEEVRKSFYSKALRDDKIMQALESLSKTMSKNPVESAFYSIDIKAFLK